MINSHLRKLITAKELYNYFNGQFSESYITKVLNPNNSRDNKEINEAAEKLAKAKLSEIR